MESTTTPALDQFDGIEKTAEETDETAIGILIQDLIASSRLQKEDGVKLLLSLSNVLQKSYLGKERTIMIKHSFNFYADLSRQMGVPENLISENLTHAETYFDEKFNKKI
jgi:hypothetical protein